MSKFESPRPREDCTPTVFNSASNPNPSRSLAIALIGNIVEGGVFTIQASKTVSPRDVPSYAFPSSSSSKQAASSVPVPGSAAPPPPSASSSSLFSFPKNSLLKSFTDTVAAQSQHLAQKATMLMVGKDVRDFVSATCTLTSSDPRGRSVTTVYTTEELPVPPASLSFSHEMQFNTTVPLYPHDPSQTVRVRISIDLVSGAAKSAGTVSSLVGGLVSGGKWPLGSVDFEIPPKKAADPTPSSPSPSSSSSASSSATSTTPLAAASRPRYYPIAGTGKDFWVGSESPSVKVLIVPDRRSPPPFHPGWSLTDPTPSPLSLHRQFVYPALHPANVFEHIPLTGLDGMKLTAPLLVLSEHSVESSLVLPLSSLCSRLSAESAAVSAAHSWELAQSVRRRSGQFVDDLEALGEGHASCRLSATAFVRAWSAAVEAHPQHNPLSADGGGAAERDGVKNRDATTCTVRASLQSGGNVFARELLSFEVGIVGDADAAPDPAADPDAVMLNFYAPVVVDKRATSASAGRAQLGSVKFDVTWGAGTLGEGVVNLDGHASALRELSAGGEPVTERRLDVTIVDPVRRRMLGTLKLCLSIKLPADGATADQLPTTRKSHPKDGLVSIMGLGHLGSTQLDDLRNYDCLPSPLGDLLSTQWLEEHASDRANDSSIISNYASVFSPNNAKTASLSPKVGGGAASGSSSEPAQPPHKRRHPGNFRPSSSKTDISLAPIAINLHRQTISLERTDAAPEASEDAAAVPAAPEKPRVLNYITCGAPCDHSRGFGRVSGTHFTGGLRKLEAKRIIAADAAQAARLDLMKAVKQSQDSHPDRSHIPTNEQPVQRLRALTIEREQVLSKLTWECAVRRSVVFSHALSIAVTSYLTSLSDPHRGVTFHGHWVEHGYLLTVEGMLSATGKELHMIEDASVGIEMLRQVEIVITREGSEELSSEVLLRSVPVRKSQAIVSLALFQTEASRKRVVVVLGQNYYDRLCFERLRNNTPVVIFPVLFQMGVDIKQYAKNFVSKAPDTFGSGGGKKPASIGLGGMGDEHDPDGGTREEDSDLLVALNLEGFKRLNVYAHRVQPLGGDGPLGAEDASGGEREIPIHPMLGHLWDFVRNSSHKIEHGVLDAGGAAGAALGGGGVIYCKSGKDRTGMGVTLRQAQFLTKFNRDKACVQGDANLMRRVGCRIAICEKNIGEGRYAFNSLQSRFMPELLRPPEDCLSHLFDRDSKVET